jgi:mono/diheme cytochrome c family protein
MGFLAAALGLGMVLVGCDRTGSYPTDLRYPERTDLLVVQRSEVDEYHPVQPGKLQDWIDQTKSRGGKVIDPRQLKAKQRRELNAALRECFGTPAQPRVLLRGHKDMPPHRDEVAAAEQCLKLLLPPAKSAEALRLFVDPKRAEDAVGVMLTELRKGGQVYRRHCLQCHGLAGDGRGSTGPWVNPFPRDYRQGLFKFISNSTDGKPSRADLKRTVVHGLDGSTMPAFGLLNEDEIEQVVSYVMHLSMRGETEYLTIKGFVEQTNESDLVMEEVQRHLGDQSNPNNVIGKWTAANTYVEQAQPAGWDFEDEEKRLAAVTRGFQLMAQRAAGKDAPTAICLSCHIDFGRQAKFKPDDWGTLARPVNFTAGVYRGGRRPIDFYYRIKYGIPGSGMSSHRAPVPAETEAQIWSLVAFVQAAPYPAMLPPEVRDKLYPQTKGNAVAGR